MRIRTIAGGGACTTCSEMLAIGSHSGLSHAAPAQACPPALLRRHVPRDAHPQPPLLARTQRPLASPSRAHSPRLAAQGRGGSVVWCCGEWSHDSCEETADRSDECGRTTRRSSLDGALKPHPHAPGEQLVISSRAHSFMYCSQIVLLFCCY